MSGPLHNDSFPTPLDRISTADTAVGALEFFNQTSRQLSNSYHFLEGKVAQLTRELTVVSAQKDVELEKKNRLANRMQALLDFLPGGVVVLDARGSIVQSNPAARAVLNHPLDGALWRDVITHCFAPRGDD